MQGKSQLNGWEGWILFVQDNNVVSWLKKMRQATRPAEDELLDSPFHQQFFYLSFNLRLKLEVSTSKAALAEKNIWRWKRPFPRLALRKQSLLPTGHGRQLPLYIHVAMKYGANKLNSHSLLHGFNGLYSSLRNIGLAYFLLPRVMTRTNNVPSTLRSH